MLNKDRLRKYAFVGDKQPPKKRDVVILNSTHQEKTSSTTLRAVAWNDNRLVYIASTESSEPKRFVWRLNKVERKYIVKQEPN